MLTRTHLLQLLAATSLAPTTRQSTPREKARAVFASAERIPTPDGIQTEGWVRIGGIDQWVSTRSRHRNNPILLFLHGGPGFTSIPASYYYMAGWDEYFTFVQWDQRGAGKTFAAHDPAAIRPTMTVDRMVDDAEELVRHLQTSYGRRKIVLMGHSWGTVLGVKLAQRHPEWFSAYVGMGQFVNFKRSEAMGYAATLAHAREAHNAAAVSQLRAIAPFPDLRNRARNLHNLGTERRWLEYYDGDSLNSHGDAVAKYSPDVTAADLKARDEGMNFSLDALWGALYGVDFSDVRRFRCPVVIMQGRRDLSTSAALAGQWYEALQTPHKQLIWFEDSAHIVYEEEPGKVLVSLAQSVLPLALSS